MREKRRPIRWGGRAVQMMFHTIADKLCRRSQIVYSVKSLDRRRRKEGKMEKESKIGR
jgi:hypothetical protein